MQVSASTSYNSAASYFHFCHFYFQREINFWLIHLAMTGMFRGCLGRKYLKYLPYFDFLIFSNIFLYNFLLFFWLATLTFMGPIHISYYLPIITMQVGLICFFIFKSSVPVFCRNSVFWFLSS